MIINNNNLDLLIRDAQSVLQGNWKEGYTIPSSKLYPFQWNWDSGFVALGLAQFNIKYAIQELVSLFSGQWQNGMIPHIIFHSEKEKTYFPNYDFWNSNVNAGAPLKPKTSGITQPPVHGFILEHLFKRHPQSTDVQNFVRTFYSKVLASHRFFYQERDPNKEGLVTIIHPWESGRDNSPLWDEALNSIVVEKETLGHYTRRDTSIADPSERPTGDQYDRYVYLLQLGKKYQYEGPELTAASPFLIQDSMMNAILIKSNQSLIEMGKALNLDTGEVEEWQQQSLSAYNKKMWNEELSFYTCYDLRNQKQIKHREIGGLVSLFSQLADDHKAGLLNDYLLNLHHRHYYLCPSFDVDSPLFDSKRYWRGPSWPQMNWMIYQGLKAYGFDDTAKIIKSDLLELVSRLGFYEYFESQKEQLSNIQKGYGGNHFSWTASTVIDLMTANS